MRSDAHRASDRQQRRGFGFLFEWPNVNWRQVAVATFPTEQICSSAIGVFSQTGVPGRPTIATAGSGSAGTIQANALESSNVDTTNQLVNLVVLQRNYQANAKALQTQDSILGTIMQIQTQ